MMLRPKESGRRTMSLVDGQLSSASGHSRRFGARPARSDQPSTSVNVAQKCIDDHANDITMAARVVDIEKRIMAIDRNTAPLDALEARVEREGTRLAESRRRRIMRPRRLPL
jgi:hypothetical protein